MSTAFSRSSACIQCSTDLLTVLQPLLPLLHTQEISLGDLAVESRSVLNRWKRKQHLVHKNAKKSTTAQYPRNVFAFFQDLLHCHCKIFSNIFSRKVVVLNNEDAKSWRDLFFILSTSVVKVVYTQCLCLLLCSLLKGHRSEEEEESERKKKKAKAAKVFFSSFSPQKSERGVAYLRVRSAWGYYYQIFIP